MLRIQIQFTIRIQFILKEMLETPSIIHTRQPHMRKVCRKQLTQTNVLDSHLTHWEKKNAC